MSKHTALGLVWPSPQVQHCCNSCYCSYAWLQPLQKTCSSAINLLAWVLYCKHFTGEECYLEYAEEKSWGKTSSCFAWLFKQILTLSKLTRKQTKKTIQNFCKRKRQLNTQTVLWAENQWNSFPCICDLSHKHSSLPRHNNSYCLLSFAFDSIKRGKHLWWPIWKHLCWPANTHTEALPLADRDPVSSDTFLSFSHWLPVDHQQGLCFLGSLCPFQMRQKWVSRKAFSDLFQWGVPQIFWMVLTWSLL